ncbi:hypothetical protein Tco_0461607 [Tanacetum coccineum]
MSSKWISMMFGLRYVGGTLGSWLEFDSMDKWKASRHRKALKEIFLAFKRFSHDLFQMKDVSLFYGMVNDGPNLHGRFVSLTESLHRVIESFRVSYRNRTYRIIATEYAYWRPIIESHWRSHLDVDSCDLDSPKNVNMIRCRPSIRVLREEDVRWGMHEKIIGRDPGEILGVHSQGDCGNVTTDDNEDVTQVIAPEKDSIVCASIYPDPPY